MTDDQQTPAEALAAIEKSRRAVHDRAAAGGWGYDLTYAVVTAGMVGGQAFDNPWNVVASTLGVLALIIVFRHETRRTGLRLTGLSPRWARSLSVGIGLLFAAAIIGLALVRRQAPGVSAEAVAGAAALVTFGAALIGARVWRRVYRAGMRLDR